MQLGHLVLNTSHQWHGQIRLLQAIQDIATFLITHIKGSMLNNFQNRVEVTENVLKV